MTTGGTVEFNEQQVEALRDIVEEWIGEGFTTPPYTSEQYDIFEALGISESPPTVSYDVRRPSK